MTNLFSCPILLYGPAATVVVGEVQYIIRPTSLQSQSCVDPYINTECVENDLTLSQFVDNSSNCLANDTRLIFSPGNYSLDSDLIVRNIHSFSMLSWPATSSKVVITCNSINARFEFRNISIVYICEQFQIYWVF